MTTSDLENLMRAFAECRRRLAEVLPPLAAACAECAEALSSLPPDVKRAPVDEHGDLLTEDEVKAFLD